MSQYYITTSRNGRSYSEKKAMHLAAEWGMIYVKREHMSMNDLFSMLPQERDFHSGLFVVGEKRIELYKNPESHPLFFHPNAAMFRAKHLMRYGSDPLIDAAGVKEGDHIVDATLGMGSDAQLFSLAAGKRGIVTGLESSPDISIITSIGLQSHEHDFAPLLDAMRRIKVYRQNHLQWMRKQHDRSVDIVYFDPMFHEQIDKSDGISTMRAFAVSDPLTEEAVKEACRIARKRVVLKDHFRSSRFDAFGFRRTVRKSSKIHYGIIEHSGGSV